MEVELDNGATMSGEKLKVISLDDWVKEAESLFGKDPKNWRFVCPNCGHIQSPKDFIEMCEKQGIKDLSPETAWFSCIGRWIDLPSDKIGDIYNKKQPCNYTNGGLFCFAKTVVVDTEGKKHTVFEFDKQ